MVQLEGKHVKFVRDMVCSGFTVEEIYTSFLNMYPDMKDELSLYNDPEKALITLTYRDSYYDVD